MRAMAFTLIDTDQEACNRWLNLREPQEQQVWTSENIAAVQSWIQECCARHGSSEKLSIPFVPSFYSSSRSSNYFNVDVTAHRDPGHCNSSDLPTRILDLNPLLSRRSSPTTKQDGGKVESGDIALVDKVSIKPMGPDGSFQYAALSYPLLGTDETIHQARKTHIG